MTGGVLLAHAADAGLVLASAGAEEGGGELLPLLLLLAGPLFYLQVHLRYRNTDKRHAHEAETRSEMLDVRSTDTFVTKRTELKSARMQGATSRRLPPG